MKTFLKMVIAGMLMAFSSLALAEQVKVGDLVIIKPEIRATPASAPVSAGYLKIMNQGDVDDKLVSASAPFAGMVQLHRMEVVDGVARMREQEGGIVIPAGGEVILEKGGLHIMFMRLGEQMKEGEARDVVLTFEKAGNVSVSMDVVAVGGESHSGHGDHGGHDHGEKKKGDEHNHGDGDHSGHSH